MDDSGRIRSDSLVDTKNHFRAAKEYERLANNARGIERDRYYHQAAGAWLLADKPLKALTAAQRSHTKIPDDADSAQQLVAAKLALHESDMAAVDKRLSAVTTPVEGSIADDYWSIVGRSAFLRGDAAAAVNAFVEREAWLLSSNDIADNQQTIWNGLQAMVDRKQMISVSKNTDDVVTGWLRLGQIFARNGYDFITSDAYLEWQREYFEHPAIESILDPMLGRYPTVANYPRRVALLLPLTGDLASIGEAVANGFGAAQKQTQATTKDQSLPEVVVYDTAIAGAEMAYRQAISQGADAIVGPLTKDSLDAIGNQLQSRVTHLALNQFSNNRSTPRSFFQFSLAPEHEAKQIAQNAVTLDQSRAIAIAPDNEWGKRILESFEQDLADQGGELLDYYYFNPEQSDFTEWMQALLHTDQSQARKDRLAGVIGRKLEFEPRRRQDIDFIFLAARPMQGRLIRPQLRFHYATGLPIYAISAVFQPHPTNNIDLEGVYFCDMPWVLSPDSLPQDWRLPSHGNDDRYNSKTRLFAMGFDAYRLLPYLHAQTRPLSGPLQGLTGTLTLSRNREIVRQLDWAMINDGNAVWQPTPSDALDKLAQENLNREINRSAY
ncbi:MAG: penicillin-binding protein activator [Gammaproteobacteria bacterium]|nr:penicillin-binding protein activator [Gammaproteobacteria bacterium]